MCITMCLYCKKGNKKDKQCLLSHWAYIPGDMTENEGLNIDHHSFPWHSTFFLRINFKGCITFHCLDNYTLANQSPIPIVWHLGFSKFRGLHKCAFMIISSGYKQRSGTVGSKYMNIPKVFPTIIKIPSQSCPNFYLQL